MKLIAGSGGVSMHHGACPLSRNTSSWLSAIKLTPRQIPKHLDDDDDDDDDDDTASFTTVTMTQVHRAKLCFLGAVKLCTGE